MLLRGARRGRSGNEHRAQLRAQRGDVRRRRLRRLRTARRTARRGTRLRRLRLCRRRRRRRRECGRDGGVRGRDEGRLLPRHTAYRGGGGGDKLRLGRRAARVDEQAWLGLGLGLGFRVRARV